MPQKDIVGVRSPEDGDKFGRALKQMGSLYASMSATAVLQQKFIPERPSEYDGRLVVFLPPASQTYFWKAWHSM